MVSLAQIIQSRFAVGGMGEAVLGALAVAGKRNSHSLHWRGRASCFICPNWSWRSLYIISTSVFSCMLPSLYSGKTKWSQEYTSPLNSMTPACPQVLARVQTPGCTPTQLARVESNSWMKNLPTSSRTHSSNRVQRKFPHCSGDTEKSASFPLLAVGWPGGVRRHGD